MPSEFDEEIFNQQIDQIVTTTTATQADALVQGLTIYYKAASDDINRNTRLTNVQKNAIKKLSAQHFGYISEFNSAVGDQIKNKAKELLAEEKGYAEISAEIKGYAEDVFKGSETVTINNVGKTRTITKVGKDGTLKTIEKVIEKPYVTNVQAYSDMLARTATRTAWEQGRASEYQRMGFTHWRYVASGDERTRPDHMALHGQVFEYGTPESDMAESVMHEPHCRCRQIVHFNDDELDTPQSVYDEQKMKTGLQWDDDKGEWAFK